MICAFLIIVTVLQWPQSPKEGRLANVVSITPTGFEPASLEIDFGDTVLWVNVSNRHHRLAAKNGSFESPVLKKGDSFRHIFSKSGVFKYYCKRHRLRQGSVKVFIH